MASRGLFYDDIWLIPRHESELESRGEANTKVYFCGEILDFPVLAAPMPDVCDRAMAAELYSLGGMGIIHRFQTIEEQCENLNTRFPYGAAIGVTGDYLERFEALYENGCKIFCIDVANGHSKVVEKAINEVRKRHNVYIIAGNVASKEGFAYLSSIYVDAVRCGIAGGCFTAETKVTTKHGPKNINKIELGDEVLTHTGDYKKVTAKLERLEEENLIDINGIHCTRNHEFYVVHKSLKDIVDEDNIHMYAKWVSAEELSEDYLLIKITENTSSDTTNNSNGV